MLYRCLEYELVYKRANLYRRQMASGYGINANSKELLVVAGLAVVTLFFVKNQFDKVTDPLGDVLGDVSGVVHDITNPVDTIGDIFGTIKGWGDDDRWFS